jgi:SAM-dependent methyltransferase
MARGLSKVAQLDGYIGRIDVRVVLQKLANPLSWSSMKFLEVTWRRLDSRFKFHPGLQLLRRVFRPAWFFTLHRTTPLSPIWGFDRGTPIDRYYIERFLEEHRSDIRGRALEVKDIEYITRYGIGVERSDVLDIDPRNSHATFVADLAAADSIPSNTFDCFILTQTLHLIRDTRAAIDHAYRILRPGGVLLVTVPSISRIVPGPGLKSDYWRFTAASCSALFAEAFGARWVTIRSYGNVLAAIAFLSGMACQELSRRKLEAHDEYFPVIIGVRAVKEDKVKS